MRRRFFPRLQTLQIIDSSPLDAYTHPSNAELDATENAVIEFLAAHPHVLRLNYFPPKPLTHFAHFGLRQERYTNFLDHLDSDSATAGTAKAFLPNLIYIDAYDDFLKAVLRHTLKKESPLKLERMGRLEIPDCDAVFNDLLIPLSKRRNLSSQPRMDVTLKALSWTSGIR